MGIGVIDVGDTIVDSGLLIDKVELKGQDSGSTEIPEPSSLFLMSLGALGVISRKKIKKI